MTKKYSLIKKIVSLYINPLKTMSYTPSNVCRLISNFISAFRSKPTAAYPMGLFIEPSGHCNIRCKTCVTVDYRTRDKGLMEYEKYIKIVDAVKPAYLVLGGYGEPTMNKNYFDMIRYAKSKKVNVKSVTNATLLDEKKAEELVLSGLDLLNISLDGATKEIFEKVRVGADYDTVVRNIKLVIEAKKRFNKKKPAMNIDMTLIKDNVHEISKLIQLCHNEFGVEPVFSLFMLYDKDDKKDMALTDAPEIRQHLIDGIKEAEKVGYKSSISSLSINLEVLKMKYTKKVTSPCFLPWLGLNVTWDGRAFPCCYFYDCQIDLGNVFDEGFESVWNGSKYQEFRRSLAKSRQSIKVCSLCTIEDEGLNEIFRKIVTVCPPIKKLSSIPFDTIHK